MDKRMDAPVGVGVISILTVLLVLALTLFSALTLTSARADMALSRRNADTVAAWYKADAEATRLYREFAGGLDERFDAVLTVTDGQNLELSLFREPDGSVSILSWRAAPAVGEAIDDNLNVWDGTLPE